MSVLLRYLFCLISFLGLSSSFVISLEDPFLVGDYIYIYRNLTFDTFEVVLHTLGWYATANALPIDYEDVSST